MGIILIDPAWAGFYLRRTAKCYYLQEEKLKREVFLRYILDMFYLKKWRLDSEELREMITLSCEKGHVRILFSIIVYYQERVSMIMRERLWASQVGTLEEKSDPTCSVTQLCIEDPLLRIHLSVGKTGWKNFANDEWGLFSICITSWKPWIMDLRKAKKRKRVVILFNTGNQEYSIFAPHLKFWKGAGYVLNEYNELTLILISDKVHLPS